MLYNAIIDITTTGSPNITRTRFTPKSLRIKTNREVPKLKTIKLSTQKNSTIG